MSLREVTPETGSWGRKLWHRLHYVPLVLLLVAALVVAAIGYFVRQNEQNAAARAVIAAEPAGAIGDDSSERVLPASCRPEVEQPPQQLWLEGRAAEAEAIWALNDSAIVNDPFIRGEEGWIFWNDGEAKNFSQAVGRRVLSNAEVARWHAYLANLRDTLAERGILFYVAVTPAKWSVYPQYLPEWAQNIRGSGPLDQLLAASYDLPIIDVRADLRAESKIRPVFSKLNSHWTDYGAYVGWNAAASCMAQTAPELSSLAPLPISGVRIEPDHNEFAPYGVPGDTPDWTTPAYTAPLRDVTMTAADGTTSVVDGETATDLASLPVTTVTPGAQVDKTALVLRDSFGNALSVPLQQAFANTRQVRHNFDYPPDQRPDVPALVEATDPDVVILQIAERHLTFAP